jgi:hypothetical protein
MTGTGTGRSLAICPPGFWFCWYSHLIDTTRNGLRRKSHQNLPLPQDNNLRALHFIYGSPPTTKTENQERELRATAARIGTRLLRSTRTRASPARRGDTSGEGERGIALSHRVLTRKQVLDRRFGQAKPPLFAKMIRAPDLP